MNISDKTPNRKNCQNKWDANITCITGYEDSDIWGGEGGRGGHVG